MPQSRGGGMNMMNVPKPVSSRILRVKRTEHGVILVSRRYKLRILAVSPSILHVSYTERRTFSHEDKPELAGDLQGSGLSCLQEEHQIRLRTAVITAEVSLETGSITFYKTNPVEPNEPGELLFAESEERPHEMEKFSSYRLTGEAGVGATVTTADGTKDVPDQDARRLVGELYHVRENFHFQKDESVYGMGQMEEPVLNLRGRTVYAHQANRKIAVPLLISSLGYGVLFDTLSPVVFRDSELGASLYGHAAEELEYYFMAGEDGRFRMEGAVAAYRKLTGKAPLLPGWCFGYLQSKERYCSQEELLTVAETYRKKHIGLDGVILDWCSWRDGQWGQKTLDPDRFPDAAAMNHALHLIKVHSMISIWPNMDESCPDYREMREQGCLLPASHLYDAFDRRARSLYWKQIRRELYRSGFDAFWMDSSEGVTPEWEHSIKPEPWQMMQEFLTSAGAYMPEKLTNAYSLFHALGVYEHFKRSEKRRKQGSQRRPVILTRSATTGQQRYGCILWSGDTGASWDTLRTQVLQAQSFSLSGFPYWSVDIGGFFVKRGEPWYWSGEYPKTWKDPAYRELYVRWFQFSAFLPIFRAHGTDCSREVWQIKEPEGENSPSYDALIRAIRIRYLLLPYIYSEAGKTWLEDGMLIRPLVSAFPDDRTARAAQYQYLFGPSLLVCPVLKPGIREMEVYLPRGTGWYDWYTGQHFEGGQWIRTETPYDRIPLYVMEGSIIPVADGGSEPPECAEDALCKDIIRFRVYPGRDGTYAYYSDAGDGYGYEKGEYRLEQMIWDEQQRQLFSDEKPVESAAVTIC